LSEVLEDGGYAVEAFAAGVHPREERVEFVGDAFLLVEGGEGDLQGAKKTTADRLKSRSSTLFSEPRLVVPKLVQEELLLCRIDSTYRG